MNIIFFQLILLTTRNIWELHFMVKNVLEHYIFRERRDFLLNT